MMALTCKNAKQSFSAAGVPTDSITEAKVFTALEKLGIPYHPHLEYPFYGLWTDAYVPSLKLWIEVYGGSDPNTSKGARDYYDRMEAKKAYFQQHAEHNSLLVIYSDLVWRGDLYTELRDFFDKFVIGPGVYGLPKKDYYST